MSAYTKQKSTLPSPLIPGNHHSAPSSVIVADADFSSKWSISIYMWGWGVGVGCLLLFYFVLLCDQIVLLSTMSPRFIHMAACGRGFLLKEAFSVPLTGHVLRSPEISAKVWPVSETGAAYLCYMSGRDRLEYNCSLSRAILLRKTL